MLLKSVHALLTLSLLCGWASAGPWMRAPDTHFLSFSVEANEDNTRARAYGSIYYEFGLRPNLTMGLDAGRDSRDQTSALIFARHPIWNSQSGARMAAELALGSASDGSDTYFTLRPGLSWGRSLNWGQGGWLTLDATLAYVPDTGASLAKLEGTLGYTHSRRIQYLLQLTAEKPNSQDPIISATPGIAWRVGNKTQLLGGFILRSKGGTALKLGFWRDF